MGNFIEIISNFEKKMGADDKNQLRPIGEHFTTGTHQ
jgi:hypothetical protein